MASLLQSLSSLNPFGSHAPPPPPQPRARGTITELRIYPVKSCRGISVARSRLTPQGLDLDRNWMFARDAGDGSPPSFVTIRDISRLTLVDTALVGEDDYYGPTEDAGKREGGGEGEEEGDEKGLRLILSVNKPIPSHAPVSISLPARPSATHLQRHTTYSRVSIWGIPTDGYVYEPSFSDPLISALGLSQPTNTNSDTNSKHQGKLRLVYKGPEPRVLRGNGAPAVLGREQSTNFPDVLPLLIANEASLEELRGRLRERAAKKGKGEKGVGEEKEEGKGEGLEITMERFRPNIVVAGGGDGDGMPAWSEDGWKTVRIVPSSSSSSPPSVPSSPSNAPTPSSPSSPDEAITIDVQARCARCQVPNVDPSTAAKDAREPWDTLVSYRRVDPGVRWKPCFGMLACPRGEGGEVSVHVDGKGSRLEVVETVPVEGEGEHVYVKGF